MERDTLKMKNKTKLISLLGLVVLALMLGGCGWQFVAFSYDTVIEAEPAVNNLASAPIIGADGEEVPLEYTTPIGTALTGNPAADFFMAMIGNSEAVDATKVVAVSVVGDPGSIGAFRIDNRLFKKITVSKRVFQIKTKDSK